MPHLPPDLTRQRDELLAACQEQGLTPIVGPILRYAIFLLSLDGRCLTWNLGVRYVLGYEEQEFLGLSGDLLFSPEDRAVGAPQSEFAVAREHGFAQDDRWMVNKAGEAFWANGVTVAIRGTPPSSQAAGPVLGYVKVMCDRTVFRQTEERLQQFERLRAVGRLAGSVAHELNNMMTVVLGLADDLERLHPAGDQAHGTVRQIWEAAKRAADVTRRLLAYSNREPSHVASLSLAEVVAQAEPAVRHILGEDVVLVTETTPGLAPIRADRLRVEQMLLDLAMNAREAMPAGGRTRISLISEEIGAPPPGTVSDEPARPGRYVVLTVADSGRGMHPDILRKAFEPFFTTKEVGQGMGLGLTTVQGTMREIGGFVRASSTPGLGSTFCLYFPEFDVERQVDRPPTPEPTARPNHGTVLVVEDEPMVRRLIVRQLQPMGLQIESAGNGREALEKVERLPDLRLVVTDVVMPEMGGRELGERLAELRPGLPVLYVSGYTQEQFAMGEGVSEETFLQKPFTSAALLAKARHLLNPAGR